MLIDTSRMMVIRMWKGYRNAQCGWMHGSEGVRRPKGLYLVIYSAQRGIVEVWRARYGPRVYSFAVGGNATLFTRFDTSAKKASCLVLTESSRVGVSELIALQPNVPNASILLKYFTQNKLQEENFLLHQIIASLQAFVKRKKIDRVHTLEQDAIEPLMDDMATLSSSTTIQALLEVLLSADMMFLSAAFLLKALSKLQMVCIAVKKNFRALDIVLLVIAITGTTKWYVFSHAVGSRAVTSVANAVATSHSFSFCWSTNRKFACCHNDMQGMPNCLLTLIRNSIDPSTYSQQIKTNWTAFLKSKGISE